MRICRVVAAIYLAIAINCVGCTIAAGPQRMSDVGQWVLLSANGIDTAQESRRASVLLGRINDAIVAGDAAAILDDLRHSLGRSSEPWWPSATQPILFALAHGELDREGERSLADLYSLFYGYIQLRSGFCIVIPFALPSLWDNMEVSPSGEGQFLSIQPELIAESGSWFGSFLERCLPISQTNELWMRFSIGERNYVSPVPQLQEHLLREQIPAEIAVVLHPSFSSIHQGAFSAAIPGAVRIAVQSSMSRGRYSAFKVNWVCERTGAVFASTHPILVDSIWRNSGFDYVVDPASVQYDLLCESNYRLEMKDIAIRDFLQSYMLE